MRTIRAARIDRELLLQLDPPSIGRLHSIHPNSLNILRADGGVLTVLNPVDDYGPSAIILAAPALLLLGSTLTVGQALPLSREMLLLGPLRIDLRAAQPVDCQVPERGLPARAALITARETLIRALCAQIVSTRPIEAATGFSQGIAQSTDERMQALSGALLCGAPQAIVRATQRLVGFGGGSTPSGDDFITGLLILLRAVGDPQALFGTIVQAARPVLQSTTDLGRWMLASAFEGNCRQVLALLIAALYTSDPREIQRAVRRVLAIGASSGLDMSLGVLAGVSCLLGQEVGVTLAACAARPA